jgi:hypothetical protein
VRKTSKKQKQKTFITRKRERKRGERGRKEDLQGDVLGGHPKGELAAPTKTVDVKSNQIIL